jgi:hypothetical protein
LSIFYWKFERYVLVLILLAFSFVSNGYTQDTIKTNLPETNVLRMDTLKADTTSVVIKHSPTKAALLSAALPGLGQIYNKKYWKLPFVYVGIGISSYFFVRNQRWYKNYLEGYVNYSNHPSASIVEQYDKVKKYEGTGYEAVVFKHYVDTYRSWRDWSVIALAGTYLLTIIDATVDAYLFDYDISDDLSLKVEPVMMNTVASGNAFGLKLSFNLH